MDTEQLDVIETPLDEALSIAQKDPSQANFFYDTFLNCDLFLPAQVEGTPTGTWRSIGFTEKFHPLFLKFEKGKAVPVFDTLERLKRWAETRTMDYLKIRAHQFLGVLDPSVYMVINPGNQWNYTLTPEILEALRKAMRAVTPS